MRALVKRCTVQGGGAGVAGGWRACCERSCAAKRTLWCVKAASTQHDAAPAWLQRSALHGRRRCAEPERTATLGTPMPHLSLRRGWVVPCFQYEVLLAGTNRLQPQIARITGIELKLFVAPCARGVGGSREGG